MTPFESSAQNYLWRFFGGCLLFFIANYIGVDPTKAAVLFLAGVAFECTARHITARRVLQKGR